MWKYLKSSQKYNEWMDQQVVIRYHRALKKVKKRTMMNRHQPQATGKASLHTVYGYEHASVPESSKSIIWKMKILRAWNPMNITSAKQEEMAPHKCFLVLCVLWLTQ